MITMDEIIIRELPRHEYFKVKDHSFLRGMDISESCRIIVAEDSNGEIIGFQFLVQVVHLEPIWVHPDYRGTPLAHRMWTTAASILERFRINVGFCFSDTSTVANYLKRLGLRELPYRTFLYDPFNVYPQDENKE
jgi:hypothetical protein